MDCATSAVFRHDHSESLSYLAYHSPPYTVTNSPINWNDLLQPAPPSDDVYQMQHLRFPTPPITPPKFQPAVSSFKHCDIAAAVEKRTHSVIMKVGQGQNPEHVPVSLFVDTASETHHILNHTINSRSRSSSSSNSNSSSPASDFNCAWLDCGRYFESLESLAHHVTQIHAVPSSNDGLYYCRWHGCQRSERGFNARYKMLVHVRTHTKEKPHQCHMCEKSFSRAENLKIHIRSHSGEKPYKCTFEGCQKAYSNSSDRFKHTRTHTMEKPYMCKVPGCQKRYTDPSSLRKHVKTFKHSLQIMEATSVPIVQNADNKPTRMPQINNVQPEKEYPPMPSENYNYMKIHAEHDFSLRSPNLHPFYTHATTCWLTDEISIKSAYPNNTYAANYAVLHNPNYVVDVDMDSPLDLRINRV